MNRTWEDQGKGDKGVDSKQLWQGKVGDVVRWVTWQKIVKFLVNIPAANVEMVGTWRSVVIQNRINKAREEVIAGVEENLEENKTAYRR